MSTVDTLGADASYSANPLRADRDEIRFLIGDRDPSDWLLADAEIDAAMQLAQRTGNPAGTLSTGTWAVVGTTEAGSVQITIDAPAAAGTIAAGASFTIAGNTQRYYVTIEQTVTNSTLANLTFRPGLVASAADNATVTIRLYDVFEASAICCDTLSKQFARKADVSIDGRSESFSQLSRQYADMARALRRQMLGAPVGGAKLVRA